MRVPSTQDYKPSKSLKLIPVQASLAQNAAQRPDGNLSMRRHDGSANTLLGLFGELDMTAPLANFGKADRL